MTIHEAIQERANARRAFDAAKSRAARLRASEELDWWIGKVAALEVSAKFEDAAVLKVAEA